MGSFQRKIWLLLYNAYSKRGDEDGFIPRENAVVIVQRIFKAGRRRWFHSKGKCGCYSTTHTQSGATRMGSFQGKMWLLLYNAYSKRVDEDGFIPRENTVVIVQRILKAGRRGWFHSKRKCGCYCTTHNQSGATRMGSFQGKMWLLLYNAYSKRVDEDGFIPRENTVVIVQRILKAGRRGWFHSKRKCGCYCTTHNQSGATRMGSFQGKMWLLLYNAYSKRGDEDGFIPRENVVVIVQRILKVWRRGWVHSKGKCGCYYTTHTQSGATRMGSFQGKMWLLLYNAYSKRGDEDGFILRENVVVIVPHILKAGQRRWVHSKEKCGCYCTTHTQSEAMRMSSFQGKMRLLLYNAYSKRGDENGFIPRENAVGIVQRILKAGRRGWVHSKGKCGCYCTTHNQSGATRMGSFQGKMWLLLYHTYSKRGDEDGFIPRENVVVIVQRILKVGRRGWVHSKGKCGCYCTTHTQSGATRMGSFQGEMWLLLYNAYSKRGDEDGFIPRENVVVIVQHILKAGRRGWVHSKGKCGCYCTTHTQSGATRMGSFQGKMWLFLYHTYSKRGDEDGFIPMRNVVVIVQRILKARRRGWVHSKGKCGCYCTTHTQSGRRGWVHSKGKCGCYCTTHNQSGVTRMGSFQGKMCLLLYDTYSKRFDKYGSIPRGNVVVIIRRILKAGKVISMKNYATAQAAVGAMTTGWESC